MKNKVVLITGGTSGIGKALAFSFGRAGAKVAFSGRNPQGLEQTAAELQAAGIDNLPIQADVSIAAQCEQMVAQTVAKYGKLDVLINNAGISMRALFEDLDLEVLHKLMDTNFWGTVYTTKFALPYIKAAKGSVVGVSSIAGYRGLPARTGYSASKFAMHGFLETLRTELLHSGVHVLLACPGFTASNIRNTALAADGQQQGETPRAEEKMMSAEEVADRILQATIKRKRDLVMTTQGKLAVWVNKLFPSLADKLVYNVMAKEKDSPLQKR
ncbi:SDR family oxidoreductase [Pontibacter akesuensis]|uniref:Short-chain dehydrogenase n=1 Tax=Pontibacter akesuensis TaxID=388950 RepID=A0A1I7KKP0_9BACT|nr:SDR family oxidoreductase [Pontibacter akesuensis]GHA78132.1 short chain dehydrogenase [Pontibacter akesuensis]SFU97981.1 Short-chain dehydrogenase [Pontibacter akesuensis]